MSWAVLHGWDVPASLRGGYASIGNFDGVHRGHQAMFALLTQRAREAGVPAIAITFDPPPLALLRPEALPPRLTTIDERAALLQAAGLNALWVLPTTPALLQQTAEEFFQAVVIDRLAARGLGEGPNFCFGRDRTGTITRLRQLCAAAHCTLDVIDPVAIDGQWVSSSVIRTMLQGGDVSSARLLLGRPYRLSGRVVTGAQRGRLLGVPTANLDEIATVVPGLGVYAGAAYVDGVRHQAAIHLGPNPTFLEGRPKFEVHLLDYTGDLYGRTIAVEFLQRLRDIRKFPDVETLKDQLTHDLVAARTCVESVNSGDSA
jgi:riboflavin kinase/FMN adenylyltransferase